MRVANEELQQWRGRFMDAVATPWQVERLFDRLPDIVFSIKDRSGRYVSISEAAAARCGLRRRQDAIGKTAFDLFPKPMAERYARQDERLFRTGRAIVDNLDLTVYADGSTGWCLSTKEPLFDAEQRIIGLACVSKDLPEPTRAGLIDPAFAAAIDYLLDHFDQPLRLPALAARAGLSTEQFDRRMRKIFGLSCAQYLLRLRIDHAARLLADGDLPIAAIALRSGFADQSALSRQFRRCTGFAPRQYRELMRREA
jgi:PAS domain S-box-containing protein